jgi:predicted restriction endonuclease
MLNSKEIALALLSNGFRPFSVKKRILGFQHDGLPYPVYVKTPSGNTTFDYVDKEPLVIHSKYAIHKEAIKRIHGIVPNWDRFFHNSNMKGFEKRLHKGENTIEFGIALSVQNEPALRDFLDNLKRDFAEGTKTNSDEIEEASSELALVPATTRKAIIDARVGQGQFRQELIELWGQCAVTGCKIIPLLKASHIKPWRACTNDERLDKFNGLLLNPILDAAFDTGLISFDVAGKIVISTTLSSELEQLGINKEMRLRITNNQSSGYLAWHREHIYKG